VGDTIDVPAPSGPLQLPLVGVLRDYSDLQGALIVDHELFRRNWNDDSVDFFGVYLTGGLADAVARESILARFGDNRRVFVLTNAEVRRYVLRLSDQWFAMTWVQIWVAIGVAVLGIGKSLMVSIFDRRRELGVLRAVGGLRSQIRGTIWLESVGIALVGLVLGLAFGAIHLYFMLELHARDFPGMRFDYTYPFGIALLLLPVSLAAALLSALGPAEAAVRGSLVEGLKYE
jgi:putative ABC transport system permease protein